MTRLRQLKMAAGLGLTLLCSAGVSSAQPSATQGDFALELASALGLDAADTAAAVTQLAAEGILPGDSWQVPLILDRRAVEDVLCDMKVQGLTMEAFEKALLGIGYSTDAVAGFVSDTKCEDVPPGGEGLEGTGDDGEGPPPGQQKFNALAGEDVDEDEDDQPPPPPQPRPPARPASPSVP